MLTLKHKLLVVFLVVAISTVSIYGVSGAIFLTGPRIENTPNQLECGPNSNLFTSGPITIAHSDQNTYQCIEFILTNNTNQTIYPGFSTITVMNGEGMVLFNQTLVSAGAMQFGIAPGKYWEAATNWNAPLSAVASGDKISVAVPFTEGKATTTAAASSPFF